MMLTILTVLSALIITEVVVRSKINVKDLEQEEARLIETISKIYRKKFISNGVDWPIQ